jgi:hypothetical protein
MFAKDPRCTLGPVTAKRQEKWIAGLASPYWVRRHAHPSNDTVAGLNQDEGSNEWHQVSRLITASSQAADRQERRRQITLLSAVFVAVVMLVLSIYAWMNAKDAKTVTSIAITSAFNLVTKVGEEADEESIKIF